MKTMYEQTKAEQISVWQLEEIIQYIPEDCEKIVIKNGRYEYIVEKISVEKDNNGEDILMINVV